MIYMNGTTQFQEIFYILMVKNYEGNRKSVMIKTHENLLLQVRMSYEVAQITTVTFWYTSSIWNPIIYFCMNKQTQKDLAGI